MSEFYYGPAGWAYEDWKGRVYPRRAGKGFHPLPYLARSVNMVEVNATFYAPIRGAVAESWVERVRETPGFRFVVKAWQRFTHEKGALPSDAEAESWTEVLRPLAEADRLLAVLVQFPFSVTDDPRVRDRILGIRAALGGAPVACEFRHRSWVRDEALEFLEREDLAFVNIDQPVFAKSMPGRDRTFSATFRAGLLLISAPVMTETEAGASRAFCLDRDAETISRSCSSRSASSVTSKARRSTVNWMEREIVL